MKLDSCEKHLRGPRESSGLFFPSGEAGSPASALSGRLWTSCRLRVAGLVACGASVAAVLAAQDPCVDCHIAQQREEELVHLEEWQRSPHARAGVSCADCHGGDDTTFVQTRAHRGVVHSVSRKARTHPRNLPATCGRCHGHLLRALQESQHWTLFEEGNHKVPTCYTCHEALAVRTLGSGGLNPRCGPCHAADGTHPRPEFLERGAEILRRIRKLVGVRAKASRLVLRVQDLAARHDAGDAYFEASQALAEAIEAGHAFDYDSGEPILDTAESLFSELLAALDRPDR